MITKELETKLEIFTWNRLRKAKLLSPPSKITEKVHMPPPHPPPAILLLLFFLNYADAITPTVLSRCRYQLSLTSYGFTLWWISWMPTSRVRTSRHCEDREREVTKAILLRVNSTNSSDTERRGVKCQALLGCDICHDVMGISSRTQSTHGTGSLFIFTFVPRSFIRASANSLRFPCSTPELTNGIGMSL